MIVDFINMNVVLNVTTNPIITMKPNSVLITALVLDKYSWVFKKMVYYQSVSVMEPLSLTPLVLVVKKVSKKIRMVFVVVLLIMKKD
jgi:hypothetical protein